jgi:hypothetical protein
MATTTPSRPKSFKASSLHKISEGRPRYGQQKIGSPKGCLQKKHHPKELRSRSKAETGGETGCEEIGPEGTGQERKMTMKKLVFFAPYVLMAIAAGIVIAPETYAYEGTNVLR